MIFGRVSSGKEAIVQLAILGSNKLPLSVRGIIDTGYTGALTLPVEQIEQMGLTWYMKVQGFPGGLVSITALSSAENN